MPSITNVIHKYRPRGAWQQRPISQIQKLVIHHSAANASDNSEQRLVEIMNWHLGNSPAWMGLSYHYVITKNGNIYQTNNHSDLTWHDGVNWNSLGILVDGYFHAPVNNQPTSQQLESLEWLLYKLCTEHPEFPAGNNPLRDIVGHRDQGSTACPGDILYPKVVEIKQKINQKISNPLPPKTPEPIINPPIIESMPQTNPNQAEIDLAISQIKSNSYIDQNAFLHWINTNNGYTPARLLANKEKEYRDLEEKYRELQNQINSKDTDYQSLQTRYTTSQNEKTDLLNKEKELLNKQKELVTYAQGLETKITQLEFALKNTNQIQDEKWSWNKFFVGLSKNASLMSLIGVAITVGVGYAVGKIPELAPYQGQIISVLFGLLGISATTQGVANIAKNAHTPNRY